MDHSHPTLSEQTLCRAFLISVDNMPSSQVLRSSTLEPSLTLALPSQHVQSLSLLRSSTDSALVWANTTAQYMGVVCVFPVPLGFPGGATEEPACQCSRCKRHGFDPWVRKIPWRRAWQSTPVFLSGESHGQRSFPYTPAAGPSLFYSEATTGSIFYSEWERKSLWWLISLFIN